MPKLLALRSTTQPDIKPEVAFSRPLLRPTRRLASKAGGSHSRPRVVSLLAFCLKKRLDVMANMVRYASKKLVVLPKPYTERERSAGGCSFTPSWSCWSRAFRSFPPTAETVKKAPIYANRSKGSRESTVLDGATVLVASDLALKAWAEYTTRPRCLFYWFTMEPASA